MLWYLLQIVLLPSIASHRLKSKMIPAPPPIKSDKSCSEEQERNQISD